MHEKLDKHFKKYLVDLEREYGCHYLYFSMINNADFSTIYSFQSHPEWHKLYSKEAMYKHCPVMDYGKQLLKASNKTYYSWDAIEPKNKKEENVSDARKDHEIFHGFSSGILLSNNILLATGIATEEKNQNFVNNLLKKDDFFKRSLLEMRKEAMKSFPEILLGSKQEQ